MPSVWTTAFYSLPQDLENSDKLLKVSLNQDMMVAGSSLHAV